MKLRHRLWLLLVGLGIMVCLVVGCTNQAHYMRGWQPSERIANRWSEGTIREARLSDDEKVVLAELGTPDTIRFFRSVPERQQVYEWMYHEKKMFVWFIEGKRVEYVVVDANATPLTAQTRESFQSDAIASGILGVLVGGVAAGFLTLDKSIGLRD